MEDRKSGEALNSPTDGVQRSLSQILGKVKAPFSLWKWVDVRIGSGEPQVVRNIGKGSVRRLQ